MKFIITIEADSPEELTLILQSMIGAGAKMSINMPFPPPPAATSVKSEEDSPAKKPVTGKKVKEPHIKYYRGSKIPDQAAIDIICQARYEDQECTQTKLAEKLGVKPMKISNYLTRYWTAWIEQHPTGLEYPICKWASGCHDYGKGCIPGLDCYNRDAIETPPENEADAESFGPDNCRDYDPSAEMCQDCGDDPTRKCFRSAGFDAEEECRDYDHDEPKCLRCGKKESCFVDIKIDLAEEEHKHDADYEAYLEKQLTEKTGIPDEADYQRHIEAGIIPVFGGVGPTDPIFDRPPEKKVDLTTEGIVGGILSSPPKDEPEPVAEELLNADCTGKEGKDLDRIIMIHEMCRLRHQKHSPGEIRAITKYPVDFITNTLMDQYDKWLTRFNATAAKRHQ
jgi:hypothetical protein